MNGLSVVLCLSLFVCIGAEIKGSKCNIPVIAPKNIAKTIHECQEDIKQALVSEASQFLELDRIDHIGSRRKRDVFTDDEKRIAGCLLQCVYRKRKAVNSYGFPTNEGLVNLYAEGVTDKDYLLATHQAVHYCLTAAQKKYITSPQSITEHGKTCDIAFDTFDCVSDRIGEYCDGQTP